MPPSTLVGRDAETARLRQAVRDIRQRGTAVVLRGEPGVGKTSLLNVIAADAADAGLTVLRATGLESETAVPFSGLHRLLRPVLTGAEVLAERQRAALLSAFGMADAPVTEPYLVGFAALELIADRTAETPIVVIVDDVHWLDPSSAAALAFVARRIEDESVAMYFAVREGYDTVISDGSIEEFAVPALDEPEATKVLDLHADGLPETARHRILELAAGNPLALVELSRSSSSTDGADATGTPLTVRLERAFADRLGTLGDGVRQAALVAAADDTDELAEVVRAAEVLTGSSPGDDLVARAVTAGVLVVDDQRVRFRHPLIRSACYQGALPSQRRAAHAALAEVVDSPDRRTWHLAASIVGPDDGVAADLEASATSTTDRGMAPLGVAALTRAAQLSGSDAERGRRLTTAAELAFESDMHAKGAELLAQAAALPLAEEDRLRVSWLTEWFGGGAWSGAAKVRALCDLARRVAEQGAVDRAMKMLADVALRCWWSNPDDATTRTLLETVDALDVGPDDPTLLTVLAYGAPFDRGRDVAERIAAISPDSLEHAIDAVNLGTAATGIGAFPLAAPLLDAAVLRFRTRGAMVQLTRALVAQILTDYHLGRWDAARAAGEEVRTLAVDTAQPLWGMAAKGPEALSAAAQGDEASVERLCGEAEAFFTPLGAHAFLAPIEIARGLSALSHGRHQEAYDHLRRVLDPADSAYHPYAGHWAVVDYVEAAVALGRNGDAERLARQMESLLERTGSPLLEAALLVTKPLVAPDDRAERLFREGMRGDLATWPFLHGRHLLAFGTWLRRHRRAGDSRPHLRSSRDIFDALGATPWYERAIRELRAAGEASRTRRAGARERLSPQELEIARLAATGMTNREIAQHLYLSHRTVGSHLYRLFPKLGITGRGQLSSALLQPLDPAGGADG